MNNIILETRHCEYCNKEFQVKKTSRRKYCPDNNTCKTYASQERNGRRAKAEPEPLISATDDLSKQIQQQIEIVKRLKKKYEGAKRELSSINNSINKREIERIRKEIRQLNSIKDNEDRKANVSIIKRKEEQIQALKQRISIEHERSKELPYIIKKCWLNFYKSDQELRKLKMLEIKKNDSGYTMGDSIDTILNTMPYYEFDCFENDYDFDFSDKEDHDLLCWSLSPLGKVRRPFAALFYGEAFQSVINISMWIAANLRNEYQAKILYILDNKQDDLDFIQRLNNIEHFKPSNDFRIKAVRIRGEIETSLQNFVPDFIFINSANVLRIDRNFIENIQSKYGDISIFCLSKNLIASIFDCSDIVYESTDERSFFKKGGSKAIGCRNFEYYMFNS